MSVDFLKSIKHKLNNLRKGKDPDNSSVLSTTPFIIADPDARKWYATDTLHVSCRSDKLDDEHDYAGMVLWAYNGESKWTVNGIKCRTGYIYIRKSANIEGLKSEQEKVHGKLYKSLFKEDYTDQLFATGFSFHKGSWKFTSFLNKRQDPPAREGRDISAKEQYVIMQAIMSWACTRKQDFSVDIYMDKILQGIQKLPMQICQLITRNAMHQVQERLKQAGKERLLRRVLRSSGRVQEFRELALAERAMADLFRRYAEEPKQTGKKNKGLSKK